VSLATGPLAPWRFLAAVSVLSLIASCDNGRKARSGAARILPLGDSLTRGGNPPHGYHSYRGYLYDFLKQSRFQVDFVGSQHLAPHAGGDPDHEGHSGFTIGPDETRECPSCPTLNLYDHLDRYLESDPDFVLLLIGINDLRSDGHDGVDPKTAPDKLERLVRRILALKPRTRVLLSSLLPVENPPRPWPEYDTFNQRASRLAAELPRVTFVDAGREAGFNAGDWHDGLHFSRTGAQKLAYVWFRHLAPLLRERTAN
jgi:lysophospholipase L1-like esterase